MKTIGLIGGMSWESTTSYYQIINETIKKELGGLHSAKILLYSVDFAEIEHYQAVGDWEKSGQLLADVAQRLEQAGADFIVICTNTMHKVAPQIQEKIMIPILHIAQATAQALLTDGIQKVGLLGTKYTMTQDFYKEKLIESKNPELENKDQVAHAVGVGAIKFYDLKTDRTNGYDFDLEAMVSFEGETGPYVQYAYARIQSILRKADFKPDTAGNYSLNDAESWEIIKLLQDFPRIINRAADNFEPSIIAKFAISLAQAFNKYYAHTRILDESPERDSRLALSYATAVVLKEALRLLGVEAPEKM